MLEILGSLYDTELEYDDFKNKLQELITEYVHLSRGKIHLINKQALASLK